MIKNDDLKGSTRKSLKLQKIYNLTASKTV